MNRIELIGRLGQDPELSYTTNGTARCTFSLATEHSFAGKGGNREKETAWHDITAWAQMAERVALGLKKGDMAYIEGRVRQYQFQGNDGTMRRRSEIVLQDAYRLGYLPWPEKEGERAQRRERSQQENDSDFDRRPGERRSNAKETETDDDDDLPF